MVLAKVATSSEQKPFKEASMSNQEKEETGKRIRALLEDWMKSSDCVVGLVEEYPASFAAYERAMVHQWTESALLFRWKLKKKKSYLLDEITPLQQTEEDETNVETIKGDDKLEFQ